MQSVNLTAFIASILKTLLLRLRRRARPLVAMAAVLVQEDQEVDSRFASNWREFDPSYHTMSRLEGRWDRTTNDRPAHPIPTHGTLQNSQWRGDCSFRTANMG